MKSYESKDLKHIQSLGTYLYLEWHKCINKLLC